MKLQALTLHALIQLASASLDLQDFFKVPDSCFYQSDEFFGHVPEGNASFQNDISILIPDGG